MTEHVDQELLPLLQGELDRATTAAVAQHLRTCGSCRHHLVSSAVVHGSLTSVAKAEAELRIPAPELPQSPPNRVDGARTQPPLNLAPPRSRPPYRVVAVAATVVALGLAGLGWGLSRHGSVTPEARVSAVASLRHMDAPASASGSVIVHSMGTTQLMRITTGGLSQAPANYFYEVWLLRPTTNKMLAVGILPPSGAGSFELSSSLMAQYSAIDVSLQANDGNAAHSSQSVLRGAIQTVSI